MSEKTKDEPVIKREACGVNAKPIPTACDWCGGPRSAIEKECPRCGHRY